MSLRTLIASLALLCSAAVANAQTIGNPGPAINLTQIVLGSPMGQSFTAASSTLLSVGFSFGVLNAGVPSAPVTISLLSGSGTGGALVASRVIDPIEATFDTPSLTFADFTGTPLTVGTTYTAMVSTSTTHWGVFLTDDTFADGVAFLQGDPISIFDFVFEVNGASVVPEPASGALLAAGAGLFGVAVGRRRRSR
jgi:hypothetical protein